MRRMWIITCVAAAMMAVTGAAAGASARVHPAGGGAPAASGSPAAGANATAEPTISGAVRAVEGSVLGEVWCAPRGDCLAAGYYYTAHNSYDLGERWSHGTWSVVPSGDPATGDWSGYTDMTCTSGSNCYAGGHFFDPDSLVQIGHWNGARWTVMATPEPTDSGFDYIYGIGCADAASCFAVGDAWHGALSYYPLSEYWDGSKWSIVAAPEPAGSEGAVLGGVACPAPGGCLAVGVNSTSTGFRHLTEQWNGTAWKVVSPSAEILGYLDGLTCLSPDNCDAFGFTGSSRDEAIIEHWNGKTWSQVATPRPAHASDSFLYNGWCTSPASCWTVGMYIVGADNHYTLAEHWNGSSWSIVASPTPADTTYAVLNGVACSSPTECLAVGYSQISNRESVLAERWNGARWSIVTSPAP
jgi:hypothetical protein